MTIHQPAIVSRFARALGKGDPLAERAAALACAAVQSGHVCADLHLDLGWGAWARDMDGKAREEFRAHLPKLDIVGGDADWTPLVWDGHRLYLRRYRDYERRVAEDLARRAAHTRPLDASLAARLDQAFPDPGQRAAARVALERGLGLISGGPGTGKTHTLARIIDLLLDGNPELVIGLAAPTGKAATRMAEALAAAGVPLPETGAMTLHRLLGMRPDGSCRHGHGDPLALDVLAVDEASMIDLALMARLLDALPPAARLILIGDRDQLAAVEAGAVFADLCASPALAECVGVLTTRFRFGGTIGTLADALRAGDADAALDLLHAGGEEIDWRPAGDVRDLAAAARAGYRRLHAALAEGSSPDELFERFSAFRVLCAHRHEAQTINRMLAGGERVVPGMPMMVTRNDPLLRLFNGDVGLALPDPTDGGLKACFPFPEGFRWLPFSRLPAWEAAWAMTVHKSQGSEFSEVLLALPEEDSPVLTRELVYTGVTRARNKVALWASAGALRTALSRRAERMSGLRDSLSRLGD